MAAQADELAVEAGMYFTDGTRLLRVIDAYDGQVVLEDCARPSDPLLVWPVMDGVEKLTVVRH